MAILEIQAQNRLGYELKQQQVWEGDRVSVSFLCLKFKISGYNSRNEKLIALLKTYQTPDVGRATKGDFYECQNVKKISRRQLEKLYQAFEENPLETRSYLKK